METTREELLCQAAFAAQAKRYDEMADYMKKVIEQNENPQLSAYERNYFAIAYKNALTARRYSWRAVASLSSSPETKASETNAKVAAEYTTKVTTELTGICDTVVDLLTNYLIPNAITAENAEDKVFYLSMKGDYLRYKFEVADDVEKEQISNECLAAYKEAHELAAGAISPTHPLRLGIGLSFSVFYYEILGDSKTACEVGKAAFNAAISDLDNLNSACYKDSTLIMQSLRDNLSLWSSDNRREGLEEG